MALGAVCFGVTVGYITYRVLTRRADRADITDLGAVVVLVVGGAAVTGLFNPDHGDLFGWYSIGLIVGLAACFLCHLALSGRESTVIVLGLPPMRTSRPAKPSDEPAAPQG
jgi:ABC-type uncharacterized transport system permease subunit